MRFGKYIKVTDPLTILLKLKTKLHITDKMSSQNSFSKPEVMPIRKNIDNENGGCATI